MTKLVLGVLDIPYTHTSSDSTVKSGKPPKPGQLPKHMKAGKPSRAPERPARSDTEKAIEQSVTTGEVATILEKEYHVMGNFYKAHEQEIRAALTDSVRGALVNVLAGGPLGNPYEQGCERIKVLFNNFLDSAEIEHMGVEGVPTAAALAGVNHRKKHPYAKENGRRPSFLDTTTYEQSFKAWTEED